MALFDFFVFTMFWFYSLFLNCHVIVIISHLFVIQWSFKIVIQWSFNSHLVVISVKFIQNNYTPGNTEYYLTNIL